MIYLYSLAGLGLIISAILDKQKTMMSLKAAWKIFLKMLPLLLFMIAIVSVVLYFIPDTLIAKYLGTSDLLIGALIAAALGTISLLPGFITFPLCGLLIKQGVSYTVIAAFSTSLMMVGVVTFPLEKLYFGTKLALIRNIAAFIIAIAVSLVVGIVYMEVF